MNVLIIHVLVYIIISYTHNRSSIHDCESYMKYIT